MSQDLYQLADKCMADSKRWFPDSHADLSMYALGIAGEAGEVADLVKKIARGSLTVTEAIDDLREELIDVLIYILCVGNLLHIDWDVEYAKKFQINEMRFGNGKAAIQDSTNQVNERHPSRGNHLGSVRPLRDVSDRDGGDEPEEAS